jgi:Bacterial cell division membrane protein
MNSVLKKINFLNYSILIPYLILSVVGLVVVYSSTGPYLIDKGDSPYKMVITQTAFWIISLILIWLLYHMKLNFLKNVKFVWILMWVEIALLVVARFAPRVNGAHGWIRIGGFSVQPAEYMKILIVWQLAAVFARNQEKIYYHDAHAVFTRLWVPQFIISSLLIASMPDLGNLIMIVGLMVIMVFCSGISYGWGVGYSIIGGLTFLAFNVYLHIVKGNVFSGSLSYINKRFQAFINPFSDVEDAGHQIANGYYALSNGGWFGRGLGNSVEKKGFLPEAHTDYIFPIVVEELGFFGSLVLMGLLFFLMLRIMQVGIKAKKSFNSMMCIGIGSIFLLQVVVNVGGILGLIPETGVTFPFLSQGGNSLLILSIGVGFALNISADEKRNKLVEISADEE